MKKTMVARALNSPQGSSRTKRVVWLAIPTIALLSLLTLGFCYRGHVLSLVDIVAESTGGRTTAVLSLALGLGILVCLILWMLLPIILYIALKNLGRRTSELQQSVHECLPHLARLAATLDPPPAKPVPDREPPEG
jgi:hypothetical protein